MAAQLCIQQHQDTQVSVKAEMCTGSYGDTRKGAQPSCKGEEEDGWKVFVEEVIAESSCFCGRDDQPYFTDSKMCCFPHCDISELCLITDGDREALGQASCHDIIVITAQK